jgi:hypothetical protein
MSTITTKNGTQLFSNDRGRGQAHHGGEDRLCGLPAGAVI